MTRLGLISLLFVCFLTTRSSFNKDLYSFSSCKNSDDPFFHLLANFKNPALPYETGKIKPVVLGKNDSTFIKSISLPKNLVAVTDPSADVWDDADDEGKIHADFPNLIGAGGFIKISEDILLLEIVDMYELKGESESNKQGIFSRTTFLCTFTKSGKFINALVSNFNLSNEHGSLNRWSCTINPVYEIIIKEYGSRKEQKDTYGYTATFKVGSDGKFVKTKSVKG